MINYRNLPLNLLSLYILRWILVVWRTHLSPFTALQKGLRLYPVYRLSHKLDSSILPLERQIPWINFEAQQYLESLVTAQSRVFEFGSGGSTLFFARRVREVVSVEHNPGWYAMVKETLDRHGMKNVQLLQIEPQPLLEAGQHVVNPLHISQWPEFQGYSFARYVKTIDQFPDDYFDLIFVDGRCRNACALHAQGKVKPGGYLIVDDTNRPEYRYAFDLLKEWKRYSFYGPKPYIAAFFQTTFWKRPE